MEVKSDAKKNRLYLVALLFFFAALFSSASWIFADPAKPEDLPALLTDDLDKGSLIKAVENQLAAMKSIAGGKPAQLLPDASRSG